MSVLLPKQIDVSKIKYSELKTLKSGAKSIYVNHCGSKLFVQTPVMSLPYGVNDNSKFADVDKKVDEKKFDLTLSFGGMDTNAKLETFFNKLKELEEKVISDAYENRMAWFKNNYGNNKEILASMFTPIIKHDKDKQTGNIANKYPPTLKVKIPYNAKEDKFEFDAYDMDNNEVNFSTILENLKGGKAQLIIQLNGIWFAGGMFGLSWKIVSGKFQQNNVNKIAFVVDSDAEDNADDDEDDDISIDEEVLKKPVPVAPPPSKPAKVEKSAPPKEEPQEEVVEEEEEDEEEDAEEAEEEEEEEERPPTPPPEPVKPVKKAVKKVAK
jgi:hypothetical protein